MLTDEQPEGAVQVRRVTAAGQRVQPEAASTNSTCMTALAVTTSPKPGTSRTRVSNGVTSAAATTWTPQSTM